MIAFLNYEFPLENILNSISEAALVVDNNGNVLFANKSYDTVVGTNGNLLRGKPLPRIEPSAFLNVVIHTGKPRTGQNKLQRIGLEICGNAYPIYKDGKVVGGISVFTKSGNYKDLLPPKQLNQRLDLIPDIIGQDPVFKGALGKAICAARTYFGILLMGESGVGKGNFARLIHYYSSRQGSPFISVNCASIPENLLESELFGYVEGAFTGAKRDGKKGKFELADKGTLLLDEIGDMSISMQAKLLTAIQDKQITRIGDNKTIPVDIRIVAATNKDLKKLVLEKKFREDLYYRLNVIPIKIPPLRERKEDIPLLVRHFFDKYTAEMQKELVISEELLQELISYPWPGNIRELSNVIQYVFVMCRGGRVLSKHLPEDLVIYLESSRYNKTIYNPKLPNLIEEIEYKAIVDALIQANGNKSKAIEIVGLSRKTFYNKLKKYNL